MSAGSARQRLILSRAKRAGLGLSVAGFVILAANVSLQNAVAESETRTLTMHHIHTGEDITITYMRNGRYDDAALKKLDWFMRDWRREQETHMDPRLFDILWEVNRDVDGKQPIQIVCGYRAPETNAMLRRRSNGVARTSQHMAGNAIDFFIPDASVEAIRVAGLRLQRGGVGYYPTSGSPFVHLDVGSIRHWPRMTHDQLVRVFPNGRTVHIPSDGQPLPGYALALADVERRGGAPSQMSIEAARSAGINVDDRLAPRPGRNLFAKLLGVGGDEDEDNAAARPATPASSAASRASVIAAAAPVPPLPRARPARAGEIVVASATSDIGAARNATLDTRPAATDPSASGPRLVWQVGPEGQLASGTPAPRPRPDLAVPEITGSVSPWRGPASERDRVPADLALAYAAAPPDERMLSSAPAASTAFAGLSTARDGLPAARPALPTADPWLRAVVLVPSVRGSMTLATIGRSDYRALATLMRKPTTTLALFFSDDPHLGLTADRFSGAAVAFMPTITFGMRTAGLNLPN